MVCTCAAAWAAATAPRAWSICAARATHTAASPTLLHRHADLPQLGAYGALNGAAHDQMLGARMPFGSGPAR